MWRGERGYEKARCRATWNARKPHRFPEVIVTPTSDRDIVKAIEYARSNGLRVAIRTGGHSMCGSPIRDGGMLLDISGLVEFVINPTNRTASVRPAVTARALARALEEHGLAFPVGHCGSVPLGGYLLSGGLGWNMGAWGPACMSVSALEMVTADGRIIAANDHENGDLLWAARGAGPGFFGVAIRFHIGLQPMPKEIRTSRYVFQAAEIEEVSKWINKLAQTGPPNLQMRLILVSEPVGKNSHHRAISVVVTGTAFADTQQEAIESLSPLDSCLPLDRALTRRVNEPASFSTLHDAMDALLPRGQRYLSDTLWSNDDLPELLPRLASKVSACPSARFVAITAVSPLSGRSAWPEAAFSMIGRTYVLCYAMWDREAEDRENEDWFRAACMSVMPYVIGHYVAEADLTVSPSRSVKSYAPSCWARLKALRTKHDPENVFQTYLGSD